MLPLLPDLPVLLAAARRGDATAIHSLYQAYGASLYRYCYARLGMVEAAQECTQDVFVCLWKGIHTFEDRGDGAFAAWLYTIANHVVVSYVRKWQRSYHVPLTSELNLADDARSNTASIICERMILAEAINQLSAEQQQVIALKFFAGLSNMEIAKTLGRTEGAVKALQHRALNRLQRLLIQECSDGTMPQRPQPFA